MAAQFIVIVGGDMQISESNSNCLVVALSIGLKCGRKESQIVKETMQAAASRVIATRFDDPLNVTSTVFSSQPDDLNSPDNAVAGDLGVAQVLQGAVESATAAPRPILQRKDRADRIRPFGKKSDPTSVAIHKSRVALEVHMTTMVTPLPALAQEIYENTLECIEANRIMATGQVVQQSNEVHASLNVRIAQLEAHLTSLAEPQPALLQNIYEETTKQLSAMREGLMAHVDQRSNEMIAAMNQRLSNLEAHTTNQTVGQEIPLLIQKTYENLQQLFASHLAEDKARRGQESEDMASHLRALNGRLLLVEQNSTRHSKLLTDKMEELTGQLGDRRGGGGWPFGKRKQDNGEYNTHANTAPQLLSHED